MGQHGNLRDGMQHLGQVRIHPRSVPAAKMTTAIPMLNSLIPFDAVLTIVPLGARGRGFNFGCVLFQCMAKIRRSTGEYRQCLQSFLTWMGRWRTTVGI